MERRYQLMSMLGVRNISGYNRKVKDANEAGKPIRDPIMTQMASNDPTFDQKLIPNLEPLPFIVVGAFIFSRFIVLTQFPNDLANWVQVVGLSPAWGGVIQDTASTGTFVALPLSRTKMPFVLMLLVASASLNVIASIPATSDSSSPWSPASSRTSVLHSTVTSGSSSTWSTR